MGGREGGNDGHWDHTFSGLVAEGVHHQQCLACSPTSSPPHQYLEQRGESLPRRPLPRLHQRHSRQPGIGIYGRRDRQQLSGDTLLRLLSRPASLRPRRGRGRGGGMRRKHTSAGIQQAPSLSAVEQATTERGESTQRYDSERHIGAANQQWECPLECNMGRLAGTSGAKSLQETCQCPLRAECWLTEGDTAECRGF